MSLQHKILIVDDEPDIVEVMVTRLEAMGFYAVGFTRAPKALDALRKEDFSVLITDLKMPDMDGMEVLSEAKKIDPDIEVIIFTAYGSIEGAVQAIKEGAHDYLVKPFEPMELAAKIEKALEKRGLKQRVRYLEREIDDSIGQHMYAESPEMKKVISLVHQVSGSDATVLVLGESGTGKELIARMLHYGSKRRDGKLVVMDCGATPPTLIEAELFGYQRGAYTGAVKDKKGIIEEADGGTLFLDEIGNISPELQTRLLRVLENGEFRRLGELEQRHVDIRVIAATNVDLRAKVDSGEFREDLFYRLRVITITIPPLRERREDIVGLSQIFLSEFCEKAGKKVNGFTLEAMDLLLSHHWPGNVRELKNIIQSAVVLCRGNVITPEDILPSGIFDRSAAPPSDEGLNPLEAHEKAMLIDALKKSNWVQKDAAKILGISRRVMHYKIRKFNLMPGKEN
ncbi:MAG TPA: sigma-54 dependent transcriptional regulator [Deltaproteobacteria bacterium]|jgi:DNA-binding NtrC family response regulator|nr:sigma-54-dependent Fis family transcriptional regulator [Deltaproteobacteria bacterium]HRW79391.1 sigma-54 dependent transcriptional regulator [Desulfomonilia bacterium]NMD39625.1 sigma-54-dependent Fis family transcriptional regulator [Deltaproteobacteria bacterium]HNQ85507.1 sigma-54 dependent transcriptional regulator [Deltaproteobacteria bacterium]HNS88856.1 sigma-54 dependent transcriptional regulator [Deltaproteobacteria bacterium]